MKARIVGIVLILNGFAIPFVLVKIVPDFMYSSVIWEICFWVGFIAILSSIKTNEFYKPHLQWAKYAILVNVIFVIFAVAYFYLYFYFDPRNTIGFFIMRMLAFLSNPIRSIFDKLVAKPMVQQPDGTVLVTTSFLRALLTDFFNMVFYCLMGVLGKIINDKITSAFSRPLIDRRGC
jgi:hypothetical protein